MRGHGLNEGTEAGAGYRKGVGVHPDAQVGARTNVLAFCARGMPGLVTKLATAGLLAMAAEKACECGQEMRELSPLCPCRMRLNPVHRCPSYGGPPPVPIAMHATARGAGSCRGHSLRVAH